MNRLVLLCFLLLHSLALSQINKTNERPKLVVGLVVDQMRWDYLYKYYDRYGEKGFKRLLAEGFSAENTLIPYVPTYTGIGHSTVYTGSVPAIHGIAGNDFYMRETQKTMYCAQDDGVVGVGLDPDNKQGKMSPKKLVDDNHDGRVEAGYKLSIQSGRHFVERPRRSFTGWTFCRCCLLDGGWKLDFLFFLYG